MSRTIRTEQRKRGLFGWIFAGLFWLFNAFMLFAIVAGLMSTGETAGQLATDAERAGFAAGTAIGVGLLVILWAAGALILGLLMWATSGRKVIVETTEG